jgi:hypothetical protein
MAPSASTSILGRLFPFFKWLEIIALAAVFTSALLYYAGMDVSFLIMFSLLSLSGVYFLKAYQPKDVPQDEKSGFNELLGYVMIPKVLYIGASISLVGILFHILKIEGVEQLLLIGSLSLGAGILILGFLIVGGLRHKVVVLPDLYRAIPVAFVAAYLLLR